jgi:hypothetical protein
MLPAFIGAAEIAQCRMDERAVEVIFAYIEHRANGIQNVAEA